MADRFIVAPRHESRGDVPADWARTLGGILGVRVLSASERRAQLEVEPGSLEALRERLGPRFLVEPATVHTFAPPLPR